MVKIKNNYVVNITKAWVKSFGAAMKGANQNMSTAIALNVIIACLMQSMTRMIIIMPSRGAR
jgi:hypothetical protein